MHRRWRCALSAASAALTWNAPCLAEPRKPSSGAGWSEIFLSSQAPALEVSQAVQHGHSVLVLDACANLVECNLLRREVNKVASVESSPMCVEFLTVTEALSDAGQSTVDSLLMQTIEAAKDRISPLIPSLFGNCFQGAVSCLRNPGIRFSEDEPWVIVYGIGGTFLQHTDGQALTIIVALADAESGTFTGGGTAFWSPESLEADKNASPSLVLSPPCGSAILFAGNVVHAGLAITEGQRMNLVASFSSVAQASDADTRWKEDANREFASEG